jgi:hypothetical protein
MNDKRKAPPHAWKKGQSGNPDGKKPGSRNKATQMVLAMMEGGAEQITQTIIDAAKAGDLSAARLVLERLAPPMRERPITLDLPAIDNAIGISTAQAAILQAAADGELLPGEAATLAGILESRRKAFETQELENRITALEEKTK